jgi:nucleoside-diphosphate-sugar epimerase
VVRPPLLYGPSDRLTWPLVKWAARGLFPIFSGGLRRTSLLHVRDAARALALAAETPGIERRKVLLTGPAPVTTTGLRAALERALGRRVREVRIPVPLALAFTEALSPIVSIGGIRQLRYERREAGPEEARALLGFTAEISLDEGVAESVRWYREAGWLPGLS